MLAELINTESLAVPQIYPAHLSGSGGSVGMPFSVQAAGSLIHCFID